MGGGGAHRPGGAPPLSARIHVTEAESEVLAALWRRGPLSPADLIAEVRLAQPWAPATVKTLLGRLVRKGAIRSERGQGRHLYHAHLTRQNYVAGEVQALLDRLFEGRSDLLRDHLDRALDGPS